MAVALGEQARAVAINRIVGGNPPTATQFNTSRQFFDPSSRALTPLTTWLARDGWGASCRRPCSTVKVKGHYYAVLVTPHMPGGIWYSICGVPAGWHPRPSRSPWTNCSLRSTDRKPPAPAALAHGGQVGDNIVPLRVLANQGGRELVTPKVLR